MNRLAALFALALAACAGAPPTQDGAGPPKAPAVTAAPTKVTGDQARALVSAGAKLIDVRTVEEFSAGHIEGAVNIPVQDLESRLAEVPKDRPVIVYCRSGKRAGMAAQTLVEKGYTQVNDLGGMGNWGTNK